MKHSEGLDKIFPALHKAQGEIGVAEKKSSGHGNQYADLAEIIRVVEDPCQNNGLFHMQMPIMLDGKACLETVIGHTSGQWISSTALMAHAKLHKGNEAQMMGATISYQRRYSLKSAFGIAEMDSEQAMAYETNKAVKAVEDASPVASAEKVAELTELLTKSKVNVTAWLATKKMVSLDEIKADLADQMIAHYSKESDK
jgi:hypothetical protein